MTELKLWNYIDLEDARRGLIPHDVVRMVSIQGMVDTSVLSMVIPEDVARSLGLSVIQVRTVTVADGSQRRIPKMGSLRVEILGRQMHCDAYVTPAGTMPVIGRIPIAELDLIVDPGTRELRVRSEDGPGGFLLRAAA